MSYNWYKIIRDRKFHIWVAIAIIFTAIVLIRYFIWKH